MTTTVTISHNFETAHRLPHLGGKCVSLHGHSWWTDITVTGPDRDDGTTAEFGALKHAVRGWIDHNLDHGTMLGHADPLAAVLDLDGNTKLYRFGHDNPTADEWPTVEAVARLLHRAIGDLITSVSSDLRIVRVVVSETHVNTAEVDAT